MPLDLRGGGGGRVHQHECLRIYTLDGRLEERIVSTAQDQSVSADAHDVGQISAQYRFRMLRVRLSGFDDVDQLWARLLIDPHHRVQLLDGVEVSLASCRAFGGNHPDPVVRGGVDRRLGAWPDHSPERDLEQLTRLVERSGGRGVAGDDDELYVARLEVPDDVEREAAHLVLVAGSVWEVVQVGKVDGRLLGQLLADRPEHGQPPYAGIEDADRPLVSHHVTIRERVKRRGPT